MSTDFRPSALIATLRQRAVLLDCVRSFFRSRGYWEVETPQLSHDVCVDRWLDPFIVPGESAGAPPLFLQTSPEFAMKRLLADGAGAIFQITRAYRRGERGPRHNPEFTMVEWYRDGDTYHGQMEFVDALVQFLAKAAPVSLPAPPLPAVIPRVTYDEAFERALGRSVLHLETRELMAMAATCGVRAPESLGADDRDGWLNLLLAERVEPWLEKQQAIFLSDYPASQSALAKVRDDSPPVSERFELYLDGLEICNGYQELTDADELARRMRRQAELRAKSGLSELPTDSRLLAAMRHGLPECSGVALGFDRLAMWRLGAKSIDEVIAFPIDRA